MNPPSVSIQAFNFGPPERRLFGVYHPATPALIAQPGVLLCNPFGQEAVRAHRMLRVLAERLARAGHAVLRFDYHGTGDSMGEDLDGDLAGWADDVLVADQALRSRSSVSQTAWMGMRLGAAVALRAAQRAPQGLVRLVLWDAVIDGTRYLEHLRQRHVDRLVESFSLMPRPMPTELARDRLHYRDEAIGFALSPALRAQVGELAPREPPWPTQPAAIVALTDPDDADGHDLELACQASPGRVRVVAVHHGIDWTTDTAESSALVPAPALMHLVQVLGRAA